MPLLKRHFLWRAFNRPIGQRSWTVLRRRQEPEDVRVGTGHDVNIDGLEPNVTTDVINNICSSEDYPLTLAVPLALGLSVEDYYETGTGESSDRGFGFFSLGLAASVPVGFLPGEYGSWTFGGAFYILWLGDSVRVIGRDDFGVSPSIDDVEVYTAWSLSYEY